MENEEFQIFELLKRISDTMEKKANCDLLSNDITASQIKMLFALLNAECSCEKGYLPLKELERRFGVAQSTAAGIIQRLEKKELVESVTDSEDKRIKIVRITEKGRQICRSAMKSMHEGHRQMFSGFTEEDKHTFKTLLQKILNNFQ
ncbi:MAG: MarR family transcriptional regulator [Bacteroides sp.]|nr:MarR family transcriptional regulator [Bacteroides sp.]